MVGTPLDIDQSGVVVDQPVGEGGDRSLGRVGHRVELRLRGEQSADPDPVQPADEPIVAPRLDAVRPTKVVQPPVGRSDPVVDPAIGTARVGAPFDDRVERRVDPSVVSWISVVA